MTTYSNINDADSFAEYEQSENKHPSPEQLLMRMAIEKALNKKQRTIWDYYNYDRLSTVEIARKLNLDQSTISRNIKVIERRIIKWVKGNVEVYKALTGAMPNDNE